ncbi:Kef-type K+ transport system membrane component KefB [Kitasatospora sp. SolWspMP-SS2h]|uniref:cation:proton antiporter n=1 Tax=Kitasatospora sp. SolWspMP-SS2h TaxID=1305729 RepID=UPI000DBAD9D5|nr:cation:proton antiporter [Kitasatospora sp. SolWspMP-SS2h]RAJ35252.1 Kef-type K+ transport system membrane component KefB [Kitasatospora sp. SolWspMP-SS2h]
MPDVDLFRLLAGLVLLLMSAHLLGRVFARFRQPPVIGEIVGGLLFGPSLLGLLAPHAQGWLFPRTGPAASGLALVYQLGTLLLMFLAGAQMRAVFSRRDGRTVGLVAVVGMVVPFAFGLGLAPFLDLGRVVGPAGDRAALTLVLACAVAITSIPVISRIMLDLGILGTDFARVVLSVAVLEDIALNVVISVALGMVNDGRHDSFGAAALLGVGDGPAALVYHALAPLVLFALMAAVGVAVRRRTAVAGRRAGGVAVQLSAVLAASAGCLFAGITPMYGAFLVGLVAGWGGAVRGAADAGDEPARAVHTFAANFFIPVYFAVVGLKLDLVHSFDPLLTVLFIAFACVVKAGSVYAGARWSGCPPVRSANLAVAMNARGGPGIVLATLAYDAGIIDATLFTTLVLTAVVTSLMAGGWLERAVSRGQLATDRPAAGEPVAVRAGAA